MTDDEVLAAYAPQVELTVGAAWRHFVRHGDRYALKDDLRQAARVRLLACYREYRAGDAGSSFKGFAVQRLRWAIADAIRDSLPICRSMFEDLVARGEDVRFRSLDGGRLLSRLHTDTSSSDVFAAATVQTAIQTLPPRLARVIRLRYVHDCTYAEIGRRLGVSESRAKQLQSDALRKLRRTLAPQAQALREAA